MLSPQDLYTYQKEKIVDKVVYLLVEVIHKEHFLWVTYKQLVGHPQTIENNLPPLPLSCMSTPIAHTHTHQLGHHGAQAQYIMTVQLHHGFEIAS